MLADVIKAETWQTFQIVKMQEFDGSDVYVLCILYWRQEVGKSPLIWHFQRTEFKDVTPQAVVEQLVAVTGEIQRQEIVSYKDLPDEDFDRDLSENIEDLEGFCDCEEGGEFCECDDSEDIDDPDDGQCIN